MKVWSCVDPMECIRIGVGAGPLLRFNDIHLLASGSGPTPIINDIDRNAGSNCKCQQLNYMLLDRSRSRKPGNAPLQLSPDELMCWISKNSYRYRIEIRTTVTAETKRTVSHLCPLKSGRTCLCVPVCASDTVSLKPASVGRGTVDASAQTNSNVTWRLWLWLSTL